MLSLFDLFALLVLLTAAFGWLNQVVFRLPSNIGLLLMGVVAALVIVLVDVVFPEPAICLPMSAMSCARSTSMKRSCTGCWRSCCSPAPCMSIGRG